MNLPTPSVRFCAFLIALLCSTAIFAQRPISGTVVDPTGEPIIGATVQEKGTTTGTITDFDGNFTLKPSQQNAILVFSYMGYITREISLKDGVSNVVLQEDSYALEEVVAVGYGTQTKKEITGSVASIKSEDFNQGTSSNPLGLIQGKVAGLNIIKNGGDDPANNSYDVQLRGVGSLSGATAPLYVIDGVPGGDLSSVLPSDIESIDILKDGSAAAIYGTRANAGVILITTRRGSNDGKYVAEYNGSVSTAMMTNVPRVLTADEYRTYMCDGLGQGIDYGSDTNWMDEITRTPISHTHNLSISGGTENFNFRASAGYRDMQGVAIGSDYQETSARFAANQKALNKHLELAYDFAYTSTDRSWANYDNFNQAIRANPTMPVYADESYSNYEKYGGYYESDNFYSYNPVSDMNQTTNDQKDQVVLGSIRATLNLLPGLKFSSFYSVQSQQTWNGKYEASTLRSVAGKGGCANQSMYWGNQQVVENTLNYVNQWGGHSFQALLGQGYQLDTYQGFNAYNSGFPLDGLLYNNLGYGEGILSGESSLASVGSYKYQDKLASFFARAMYNYNQKYFLSASLRMEGSSKFGVDADPILGRWGLFPSLSGSWSIKDEGFLQDADNLNDLRLRAGYGVTGNMPSSSYLYAMTVGPGSDYVYSDGSFILPWGPTSNINTEISWEEKHEYNLGIDFSAFNNRFSGTLDGYFRNTTDLLYEYSVPVPPNVYGSLWANYGQIHNYGVELLLNGNIVKTKDFRFDMSFNAAWNQNTVVRITGEAYGSYDDNDELIASYVNTGYISDGDGLTGVYTMRLAEGEAIGNFYGYKYYGINSDGEWVFETPAGGLTTNPTESDKQIIGNAQPLLTFGFTTSFNYKAFDLSMNFRGQIGGLIFNETRFFYENTRGVENCLLSSFSGDAALLTAWATSGTDKASTRYFSDFYLEDASYLKLNDLTLGYTPKIGNEFSKWVSFFRVYATVQNVFTLTNYSGNDPSSVSMSGLTPGFDGRSYYPTTRSFELGVQVKF